MSLAVEFLLWTAAFSKNRTYALSSGCCAAVFLKNPLDVLNPLVSPPILVLACDAAYLGLFRSTTLVRNLSL